MIKDFRDFISRGNVLDLAVAVIIGAAFALITKSFVDEILMPPIGLLLGGVSFSDLFITLRGGPFDSLTEAKAAGAPVIAYGNFFNTIINFLLIALFLFMIVRAFERFKRKEEKTKKPSDELVVLREIRDALKAQAVEDPNTP